jgi:hypothetical protein
MSILQTAVDRGSNYFGVAEGDGEGLDVGVAVGEAAEVMGTTRRGRNL